MKKEVFSLDGKEIAGFYYLKDKQSELEPFRDFVDEYKKLIGFFGVQPPKVNIHFLYSRAEMDKHWGEKTTWVMAMVDNKNPYLVYIFSPSVFKELTGHARDEMLPIVVHELAHTFVSQINERCFYWMNEGVCEFVIGEEYIKPIEAKNWVWFKEHLTNPETGWLEQANHQGYPISTKLVGYIIQKRGKKAVIALLKIKRVPDKDLKNKMDSIVSGGFDKLICDFEKTLNLI